MAVRPRGSGYQIDVKVGAKDNPTGEKVRVRATASDETTAYTLEAEIVKAIRKHGAWKPDTATAPSRSQGTLAAALEEAWSCPTGRKRGWKYQRSGKAAYAGAKACIDVLGPERHCATITIKDFDLLTLHFEKLGNATNTINVKIQSFRRVLFYAQRLGWIASRPAWERPSAPPPREFIFSDEGQVNLAKSGAVPTRTDVTIPQEVIAKTFDPSTYANAVGISDAVHYGAACAQISEWWAENIIPLLGN